MVDLPLGASVHAAEMLAVIASLPDAGAGEVNEALLLWAFRACIDIALSYVVQAARHYGRHAR
jgi:hypothetical protein